MRTAQTPQKASIPAWNLSQPLALLLLVLLFAVAGWKSPLQTAYAQTPGALRFTESLTFQEVSPGIEHGQTSSGQASTGDLNGPWFINVLRIDLSRATLKIVHALDEGVGLETVSSMAARYRAAAAINGGHFRTTGTYRGESTGVLLLDGKLISEPNNDRAAIGLISSGKNVEVGFSHLRFSGQISVGKGKHTVQGLNRPLSGDELIVFTPEFHRTTLTNPYGIEVVVRRNIVVSVGDLKGSSQIPADGFVISGVGRARQWLKEHLNKGSKVIFPWRLSPLEPKVGRDEEAKWRRANNIVGAGPQLIKAGKVDITDRQEKMISVFQAKVKKPRWTPFVACVRF